MKFEDIKPGMTLYDVHSERMGNTTMRSLGVWHVHVKEVDHAAHYAVVSWNGNRPARWYRTRLEKLKAAPPILVHSRLGVARRPTREERKAIVASGIEKSDWRQSEVEALMSKEQA